MFQYPNGQGIGHGARGGKGCHGRGDGGAQRGRREREVGKDVHVSQRSEYEYLTGRAEVVRAVVDKKVVAAEAWVEARQAGEKEMTMRAEAIEMELGEADGAAVCRGGCQR